MSTSLSLSLFLCSRCPFQTLEVSESAGNFSDFLTKSPVPPEHSAGGKVHV